MLATTFQYLCLFFSHYYFIPLNYSIFNMLRSGARSATPATRLSTQFYLPNLFKQVSHHVKQQHLTTSNVIGEARGIAAGVSGRRSETVLETSPVAALRIQIFAGGLAMLNHELRQLDSEYKFKLLSF